MQAILGAGGGDIEEARGLDVFGIGIEVAEVSIGGIGFGAGGFDGGEEQTTSRNGVPAFAGTTSRTANRRTFSLLPTTRDHLVKQKKIRVAAAGALVEAG